MPESGWTFRTACPEATPGEAGLHASPRVYRTQKSSPGPVPSDVLALGSSAPSCTRWSSEGDCCSLHHVPPHNLTFILLHLIFLKITPPLLLFRVAPMADGSSQAKRQIAAAAAGLHHSNEGFEPHLQPTPQVTATLDPQPTEQGQGSNLHPHRY